MEAVVIFIALVGACCLAEVPEGTQTQTPYNETESDMMETAFWKYFQTSDLIGSLRNMEPAGIELAGGTGTEIPFVMQYVCRARHQNRWVPGKLIGKPNGDINCFIPEGQEHSYRVNKDNAKSVQILVTPPGTTSWVPFPSVRTLSYVPGGVHPSGADAPICRFKDDDGYIYVGKFLEHGDSRGTCYYPWYGEKQRSYNIEVLVFNTLGAKSFACFIGENQCLE